MSYLWYWPDGGWDFDAWKKAHPWKPVYTRQSESAGPLPLLEPGQNLGGWTAAREEWVMAAKAILGETPDAPPTRMQFDTLEAADLGGIRYTHLRFRLTDSEWGYAWLLTPAQMPAGKLPAVIALHQTVPQGKDEPVGLEGSPELRYGRELAEKGFVVFAPDAIAFGERLAAHPNAKYRSADEFFAVYKNGSVMGKMAFDASRAVDLLQTLPYVDPERIGCMGHSHGAYGTLFAMLFEPRIKAGGISCGFSLLRSDPHPDRWWRRTALMPRLGCYEGEMNRTPFDFHHLFALLAPRKAFVSVALSDAIFPNTASLKDMFDDVQQVYALYNAKENWQTHFFEGGHDFPKNARETACQMMQTL